MRETTCFTHLFSLVMACVHEIPPVALGSHRDDRFSESDNFNRNVNQDDIPGMPEAGMRL
jgi:hypothetical protein